VNCRGTDYRQLNSHFVALAFHICSDDPDLTAVFLNACVNRIRVPTVILMVIVGVETTWKNCNSSHQTKGEAGLRDAPD
jgi:hypothetical protein